MHKWRLCNCVGGTPPETDDITWWTCRGAQWQDSRSDKIVGADSDYHWTFLLLIAQLSVMQTEHLLISLADSSWAPAERIRRAGRHSAARPL